MQVLVLRITVLIGLEDLLILDLVLGLSVKVVVLNLWFGFRVRPTSTSFSARFVNSNFNSWSINSRFSISYTNNSFSTIFILVSSS